MSKQNLLTLQSMAVSIKDEIPDEHKDLALNMLADIKAFRSAVIDHYSDDGLSRYLFLTHSEAFQLAHDCLDKIIAVDAVFKHHSMTFLIARFKQIKDEHDPKVLQVIAGSES